MSTHVPGIQSFSAYLHHFVLAKLAASSIRVKTGIHFVTHIQVFRNILLRFCNKYAYIL